MIYEIALHEWGRDRKQIRREWSYEYLSLMIDRMVERKQLESGDGAKRPGDAAQGEMPGIKRYKVAGNNGEEITRRPDTLHRR